MPPLSRRAFLTTGGAATAAFVALRSVGMVAAAAPAAASAPGVQAAPARLGSAEAPFTQAAFTPQLGTSFRFHAGAAPVDLQLTTVKQLPERAIPERTITGERFSMLFSGPVRALHQETYAVEHRVLGHFSLFLVPVGPPGASRGGQEYEAIVNNAAV